MNEAILKSDRRGRLRYSAEQRAALVDAYQSSGLSGPRFAAIHGVAYQTLAAWILKRKKGSAPPPPGLPNSTLFSFVPAEVHAPSPNSAPLEIILPGGSRLAIIAPGQIALAAVLIRELEKARPC